MLTDLWTKLKNESRPIVLYGMGNGAQAVIAHLSKLGIRPVGIFASDEFVRGQVFCGYTVKTYDDLARDYPNMVILVCFGSARPEVINRIEFLSAKHTLYCPDVPVYGGHIFDISYARNNAADISAVYDLLVDEESKQTFKDIILFKLSGEMKYLKDCEYSGNLFSPLFLSDDMIYMDLGAYRGDTMALLLENIDKYRHIFAVEPHPKTFQKLSSYAREFPNVTLINAAVSDCNGQILMTSDGRGNARNEKGRTTRAVTVDEILKGGRVDLIKMDVEGEEAAALRGAENTIRSFRPQMVISCYHRSEDIFSLALQVHKICPQYKVMLRHFPHNLAWETNFYFI